MSQNGENAAAPTTPSKDAGAPTPKEAMFFLAILNNMKNKPEVDWEVVAEKSGFSNGKTAAARFGQIKKKWGAMSSDVDTTASTTPSVSKTPKTPKTKTPKDKTKVGSGTNTTASKVSKGSPTPKKRGRKPKVAKEEEPEENGHDDAEMDETLAIVEEEIDYYEAYEAEEDSIAVKA